MGVRNDASGMIILIVMFVVSWHCSDAARCYVEEGGNYTMTCTGKTEGPPGYVYWEFENETELFACDTDIPGPCASTYPYNEENFKAFAVYENSSYNSSLQILNMKANLANQVIQCAVYYRETESAYVEKACNFTLYRSPKSISCLTEKIDDRGVVVKCKTPNVYPGIVFNISQVSDLDLQEQPADLREIQYESSPSPDDPNSYSVSFSAEIYPEKPGRYKFHVRVYPNVSNFMDAIERFTELISLPMAGSTQNSSMTHVYVLISVIVVVATSLILLGAWLLWTGHARRYITKCDFSICTNVPDPIYAEVEPGPPVGEDAHVDPEDSSGDDSRPGQPEVPNPYINEEEVDLLPTLRDNDLSDRGDNDRSSPEGSSDVDKMPDRPEDDGNVNENTDPKHPYPPTPCRRGQSISTTGNTYIVPITPPQWRGPAAYPRTTVKTENNGGDERLDMPTYVSVNDPNSASTCLKKNSERMSTTEIKQETGPKIGFTRDPNNAPTCLKKNSERMSTTEIKQETGPNIGSARDPGCTKDEQNEDTEVKAFVSGTFTDRGYDSLPSVDLMNQAFESRNLVVSGDGHGSTVDQNRESRDQGFTSGTTNGHESSQGSIANSVLKPVRRDSNSTSRIQNTANNSYDRGDTQQTQRLRTNVERLPFPTLE